MANVNAAIATAWDSATLNDTIPGGIWYSEVPAKAIFPYMAVTQVGEATLSYADSLEISQHVIQMTIYSKPSPSVDIYATLVGLCAAVKLAMTEAELVMPAGQGKIHSARCTNPVIQKDRTVSEVWSARFTLRLRHSV